ncbi:MAG TPA: alpha-L-fucosidase [Ruminiclostridium sp.]|nr:alpha-L-fucosidase [Ruminiclostridium sp.]
MQESIRSAAGVIPSERQYAWQQMEFYAFIHFSVNTFTDREWGLGNEKPDIFNPTELDADQWVRVCKSAGMKGLILTCKHHDGFCLWPSKYTEHSVKNSPWKNGMGDVVREVSDACRRAGLKFGIYLSPWDRHEKTYGDSEVYNTFFRNQLKELLTLYGEIFCVWFDGACGEGPNGKRQVYDWDNYYRLVREFQPKAVISVCGPDVRWCGNEAGHCRKSEWSVVPAYLMDAEKIAEKSQKADDGQFSKKISSDEEDLGSREIIENADRLIWYPAEVNTSIRPGWFYHKDEDADVKSVDELFQVYCNSVGGNANFLLNIPPDKRGLIHQNDAECLMGLGQRIKESFSHNLAADGSIKASQTLDERYLCTNILNSDDNTCWRPDEGAEKAELTVTLNENKTFSRVVLMESIKDCGQHVESFVLEARNAGGWEEFYKGTVIGYKKICCFPKLTAKEIRLRITASRLYPSIRFLGIFE